MRTKDWKAVDKADDFSGQTRTLIVHGLVEVGSTGDTPELTEGNHDGPLFVLELVITTGVGNDVMTWKDANFTKRLTSEDYSEVLVIHGGAMVARFDIEKIIS